MLKSSECVRSVNVSITAQKSALFATMLVSVLCIQLKKHIRLFPKNEITNLLALKTKEMKTCLE